MSLEQNNLSYLVKSMQNLNEKFKNQEWTEETVNSTEKLLDSLNKFIPILTDMNTKISEYSNSTKTRKELEQTISSDIINITGVNQIEVNNNTALKVMGGGFKKKKTKEKRKKKSKKTYKKKKKN